MMSWRTQQVFRNIKDKLFVLKSKAVVFGKNKYAWVVVIFVLLFASGFYVNSYTAHVVELQKESEQQYSTCSKDLQSCQTNVNATQEKLTACSADLVKAQLNMTACAADKQQLEKQYKNVSFDLVSCQQTYSSLNSSYSSLSISYDTLAKNAANNICCKKKIDDSSLKYYYIDGNSIVCSSSTSDKTKELSCPSLT